LRAAGKRTDGPVSRLINRRFSGVVTSLLLRRWRPSPNKVTVATTLIGLLPIILYVNPSPVNAALAGVLVQAASILDGVDGEVARLTGRTSRYGALLDATLDRIVDVGVTGAASYAVVSGLGIGGLLAALLYILPVTGGLLVSYIHAQARLQLGSHPMLITGLTCWCSRDVRLFTIFLTSLLVPLLGWAALAAGLLYIGVSGYAYTLAQLILLYRVAGRDRSDSSRGGGV